MATIIQVLRDMKYGATVSGRDINYDLDTGDIISITDDTAKDRLEMMINFGRGYENVRDLGATYDDENFVVGLNFFSK